MNNETNFIPLFDILSFELEVLLIFDYFVVLDSEYPIGSIIVFFSQNIIRPFGNWINNRVSFLSLLYFENIIFVFKGVAFVQLWHATIVG